MNDDDIILESFKSWFREFSGGDEYDEEELIHATAFEAYKVGYSDGFQEGKDCYY